MTSSSIDTTVDGRAARVAVVGELDLSQASVLTDAVEAAFRDGAERVIVDLHEVSFVDSSGLQGLMWVTNGRATGQELALARPSDAMRRLFRQTGLGDRLTFAEDAAA